MFTLWNRYKSTVYGNCTDPTVDRNSVFYWKNRLFAASVLYLIPMSVIAIIPGVYMAIKTNLIGLLIADFITVGTILGVALIPGLSVFARKLLFNSALYLISVVLLYYLGPGGPGLLYLLTVTIFVLLSLNQRYGFIVFTLNILICVYFSFAIHYNFASIAILSEYQLGSWIGVSSNLIFLSGTAVFLIPKLFNGFQSDFEEQNHLKKELKTSVDNLNAKNEELDQFAFIISHDLKEPLRMIRSFMELLEKKYVDQLDAKAKMYIHFAVDGANRMTDRISDLLEYSRIGRKYTTVEQVDFNEILDEVAQNLKKDIQEKEAELEVSELPTLNTVPIAMKMLLQNIVSNALKYQLKDEQPVIEIKAQENSSHWQFSISDNGIGIDPEYHDQIFSVFKRLHTQEEYPGNGMGLAICKKIVTQHDGEIWVESEKGKGSTFHFTLSK